MPNREPTQSPWQERFQETCHEFVDEIECLSYYIRKNPDDESKEHRAVVYQGLISLWSQIKAIKDAGLEMVAESPKCALILKARRYWFIEALADQTPFENECEVWECDLDKWAHAFLRNEAENLWVAGFLETMALQLIGQYYLVSYRIAKEA